jgi:hypothetical protein
MKITINDVADVDLCRDSIRKRMVELRTLLGTLKKLGYIRERVKELFGGRESITANDIATATIMPLQDRAWILSRLIGPRDTTREVARRIARDALGNREIPQEYRAWLDTGDEALRKAAGAAALALSRAASRAAALDFGRAAAWSSARSAVWFAAWSAAWFDTGDEALRKAAGAADDVARGAAAWAVAGVADDVARGAAWERYIGWMAEWLDSHETL